MRPRLISLFACFFALYATSTNAEVVVCTATKGFHCGTKTMACNPDTTYTTTYRIDRAKRTIEQVSYQKAGESNVEPDGTVYQIVSEEAESIVTGEKSIMAVGMVGLAALDTLVIGTNSYLTSSASRTEPRAFVQMGTCKGLRP